LPLAVALVVVVAVTEETIFCGYLIRRFVAVTGSPRIAVVASAVVFSLGHGYEGTAGAARVRQPESGQQPHRCPRREIERMFASGSTLPVWVVSGSPKTWLNQTGFAPRRQFREVDAVRILDALLDSLEGKDRPVEGVWSCAFWTAVTTRFTGLASTYRPADAEPEDRAYPVPDAGSLTDRRAGDLAEYARSEQTLAASIGMAAVNSLIAVDQSRCTEQSAFDLLAEKGTGRNVAVVGHFPFVSRLKGLARNLWVIEKRPRPGDYPASDASWILPRCEVVCLTATSFINHTIDGLLGSCRDSFVVLTGPTSPLTPVLFDFGIDAICGTHVTDRDQVVRFISQGATFRQIRNHGVKLFTLTKG
jgi:uncharacterized protein (DUF4213/DUF364 family)